MLGIRNAKITRPTGNRIAHVVQHPRDRSQPIRAAFTPRASPPLIIPAAPNHLGLGQILNTHDSFGRIRNVYPGSNHRRILQVVAYLELSANRTQKLQKNSVKMLQSP